MRILDEVALDKELEGPGKIRRGKTWKTIYEVVDDKYFKKSDVQFPKEFLLKCKQEFNVYHFTPLDIKNQFNKLVLNMGCFLKHLKLNGQLLKKHTQLLKKIKRETIFKFEGHSAQ